MNAGLTFRQFQEMNDDRCEQAFGHLGETATDPWGLPEWALAIAGEAGELANLAKKFRRGDYTLDQIRRDVLREVADVMTYCDCLMSFLDASTGEELLLKFDEVSERVRWKEP